MEVLYMLVPLTLLLVAAAIAIFIWALRNGQLDDLERPGHSILWDDDEDMIPEEARHHKTDPAKPDSAGEQQPPGADEAPDTDEKDPPRP